MPSCPNCARPIDFDDDICFSCGAVLSPMYTSSTPRTPPPPPRPPRSRAPPPRNRGPPPDDDYYYDNRRRPPPDDDYYYDDRRRPPPRRRRGYDDDYYAGTGGAAAYGAYDYDRRPPPRSNYPEDYPDEPQVRRVSRDRPRRGEHGNDRDRPQKRHKKDESGTSGKTIVASIIAIFLIILLLLIYFAPTPEFQNVRDRLTNLDDEVPTTPFIREYPEGVEFEFDKEIVVSATGKFTYTIKVSSPMDLPDGTVLMQDVLSVVPSKSPTEGSPKTDSTTNTMMIWEESLNGGSSTLTIDYHIKTLTTQWEMDGTQSGTVADINQTWKTVYNHDEWLIDEDNDGTLDPEDDIDNDGNWNYRIMPSHPRIKSLSDQLTADKNNVYDKVKAIYEHLISDEILDYETVRGSGLPKACLTTLDDKRGDCDDYSILFVSLCRAAGIPARLHLGLLYDPSTGDWIGHGWSGVYIPQKNGGAFIGTVDVVNKQFLLRDPYRITDWIDTGGNIIENGESVENLDYYYYSFTYTGSGSKQSDVYETQAYKPFGKVLVEMSDAEVTGNPSDGDSGGGPFGSMPGFDAYMTAAALASTVALVAAAKRRKAKKEV